MTQESYDIIDKKLKLKKKVGVSVIGAVLQES